LHSGSGRQSIEVDFPAGEAAVDAPLAAAGAIYIFQDRREVATGDRAEDV
jgi:hypothetical protein